MSQQQPAADTAVVLGGSMAGLLAARVLAEWFEHVIIVERDILPATRRTEHRRGVPQARHAHALLGHGRQILEGCFPGFEQELVERGAVRGHGRHYSGGGRHVRPKDYDPSLFVSRPLLEFYVRGRVQALANVTVAENCEVLGLAVRDQTARVVGARVRARVEGALEHVIDADLVVDASGRGSRAPAWLAELGYPSRSRNWSRSTWATAPGSTAAAGHLDGDLLVNVAPTPALPRASGMLAMEDDRWMVTLAGYFGDDPPTDEPGFLEFAAVAAGAGDLRPGPRTATPLTDAGRPAASRPTAGGTTSGCARFPDGLPGGRRRAVQLQPDLRPGHDRRRPRGRALRDCLAQDWTGWRRGSSRAAKVIAIPWSITVGNDRRSRRRPPRVPLQSRVELVSRQIARRCAGRATVSAAFLRVGNLFDPPSALLRPATAARVLWGNLRSPRRQHVRASRSPNWNGSRCIREPFLTGGMRPDRVFRRAGPAPGLPVRATLRHTSGAVVHSRLE